MFQIEFHWKLSKKNIKIINDNWYIPDLEYTNFFIKKC